METINKIYKRFATYNVLMTPTGMIPINNNIY